MPTVMFCTRCHREFPGHYAFCPEDGAPTSPKPHLGSVPVSKTKLTDALLGKRYRVRGFVGRGAMARVYLAEDEETDRVVAVKVLSPPYASDDDHRKRFLREARAVSAIGHPNIVEVLEAGIREDDHAPYIVMEFLFGEPLGRTLEREGTLPPSLAFPALRQAASALAAAHEKSIVHRDIKPDNMFLLGEPGDPHDLKVLDFGFSKLQSSKLTAAGAVLGTPGYMAPEQSLGEPVDARTDVYGLGMVMYRMFTGMLPFASPEAVVVLGHQIHTPPMPPREIEPSIDPRVERVIMTAIRKDPALRYPSMRAFFDDLGNLAHPDAPLTAKDVDEDRYTPSSTIGVEMAKALGRALR